MKYRNPYPTRVDLPIPRRGLYLFHPFLLKSKGQPPPLEVSMTAEYWNSLHSTYTNKFLDTRYLLVQNLFTIPFPHLLISDLLLSP